MKTYKGLRILEDSWKMLEKVMKKTHVPYIYLIDEAIKLIYAKYIK